MKIIVIGAGKVGETICKELSDSLDVVLIDSNPQVVENIFAQYDIQVVVGNGAGVEVQTEAGMKDADLVLAVTNLDELNIMACIIAGRLGAKRTIARVRNPEYHKNVDFIKSALGISLMINPEEESAKAISKVLSFPMALNVESFAQNRVNMVELEIKSDSILNNMSLKDFRARFTGNLLVCVVERGLDVFIPYGDTVLQLDDRIHVTGSKADLEHFYDELNHYRKQDPIRSALIVGGGRISYYLIDKLLSRNKHFEIKLIERNKAVAEEFSLKYPEIVVVNADGSDQNVLEEEGIADYDSCVALTGIDEENIFISLFAKHKQVRKCITKVNRIAMLKILAHVDLDSVITPGSIIADEIVRYARSLSTEDRSNIEHLYKLAGRRVEALEFTAPEDAKVIGIPLMELQTIDNTLVSLIVRNHEPILPKGDDSILAGDMVVIVTTHQNIVSLDDIISK